MCPLPLWGTSPCCCSAPECSASCWGVSLLWGVAVPPAPKGCSCPTAWAVHLTTSWAGSAPHRAFPAIWGCLDPLGWSIKPSRLLLQVVPTLLSAELSWHQPSHAERAGRKLPHLPGTSSSLICQAPTPPSSARHQLPFSGSSPGRFGSGTLPPVAAWFCLCG